MQVEGTRMLRVKAVAEMFDVSPQTIYRAIESGHLKAVRVGPARRSFRIPAASVEAFAVACADSDRRGSGEPGHGEPSPQSTAPTVEAPVGGANGGRAND